MKKFILNIIIMLVISISVVVLINEVYTMIRPVDARGLEKFNNLPDKFDIVNVGSSHGQMSFNYSSIDGIMDCANLGVSSQTYEYDYRLLDYYSDRINENTIVIIPYSFFSLTCESEQDRADFESHNRYYYNILPKEYIIEYDYYSAIIEGLPVLVAYDTLLDSMKDAILGDGRGENLLTSVPMEDDANEFVKKHIVEKRNSDGTWDITQSQYDSLIGCIDLCKEKGARVILVTTPMIDLVTIKSDEQAKEFRIWFYNQIDAICEEKKVEYLDYSCYKGISDNYDLFVDAHHLNKEGSILFSTVFFEKIKLR